jgi:hypothetical protein
MESVTWNAQHDTWRMKRNALSCAACGPRRCNLLCCVVNVLCCCNVVYCVSTRCAAAWVQAETRDILQRDAEDDEKLAQVATCCVQLAVYNAACCNAVLQGIQLAIARQVLPALPVPPKLTHIDVKGKTALEVRSSVLAYCST